MKSYFFVFSLVAIFGSMAVPSFCQGDLNPGQQMSNNSSITSPKGKLEMDDNLFLYDQHDKLKWKASEWNDINKSTFMVMENNGDLVIYHYSYEDGIKMTYWDSGTKGHPGAYMKIDWDHYQMKVMSADGKTVLWSSPKP